MYWTNIYREELAETVPMTTSLKNSKKSSIKDRREFETTGVKTSLISNKKYELR